MSWMRIQAVVLRQLYLIRGSMTRAWALFVWVAIDMVLWGYMTKYLNQFAHSGFSFVPVLLGSVLMWDFLQRVMHGVTSTFFEDVWTRNFLNFFASPLSTVDYVCGLVIAGALTSMVGLVVMALIATFVFNLSLLAYGPILLPCFLILFFFGIALGIMGSAVVLRLGPASEWFVWPIPAIVSPFVGVFYPLSTLPGWMQYISRALPPSYVFEAIRVYLHDGTVMMQALITGAGLAIVYIIVAGLLFGRVYRHAVRSGLIARYSAETLS